MITATGIGSGLDIDSLVTQLVAAERGPAEGRLLRQEASLTSELSAFGSFKGALASFQTSFSALNSLSSFGQRTAESSNEDIVSVSASAQATEGSYSLAVSQLATTHSLASGSYSSPSDVVGTGTLTFRFGETDYVGPDPGPESYNSFTLNPDKGVAVITIDSTNNTLEGMRDAINSAEIGVSAVIVNDGSGYRLLMSSEQTGAENSLEISVSDSGDANDTDINGLSAFAFNSAATNLEQTVAAQDAIISINGLSINSSENTASNIIDGVDIALKDLTGTAPITITIAEDRASVKEAITNAISGYNNFIETANSLTSYNADAGVGGALQGDASARSVVNQVRQAMTGVVSGFNGPFSTLVEMGITTQADGTLQVDSGKLDDALENNFDIVAGMFAAVGFPSDSDIEFVSSSDETTVGSYAVNISQLATQGQLIGAIAAFPLDIDNDNDNFTVKIDGVESASISLTQGTYATGAELASEIQSRINGDANLVAGGVSVAVIFNGDHFELSSAQYGSSSRVEITAVDVNSSAELGLSIIAGAFGTDVAGTIDGVAAIGSGQQLTGAIGSSAEDLQLQINGGLIGDRGTVDFSQGIAYQINAMIAGFLEADGLLDSKTDSLQSRVDDIGDKREILDRRMETLEARFFNQFNALDGLLAQLQSTSNFLTQQLASLPEAGTLLRNNN